MIQFVRNKKKSEVTKQLNKIIVKTRRPSASYLIPFFLSRAWHHNRIREKHTQKKKIHWFTNFERFTVLNTKRLFFLRKNLCCFAHLRNGFYCFVLQTTRSQVNLKFHIKLSWFCDTRRVFEFKMIPFPDLFVFSSYAKLVIVRKTQLKYNLF